MYINILHIPFNESTIFIHHLNHRKIMTTQEAKKIHIADYLQSLGYSPVTQQGKSLWYKSPFREAADASFKVNPEHNPWNKHRTSVPCLSLFASKHPNRVSNI